MVEIQFEGVKSGIDLAVQPYNSFIETTQIYSITNGAKFYVPAENDVLININPEKAPDFQQQSSSLSMQVRYLPQI